VANDISKIEEELIETEADMAQYEMISNEFDYEELKSSANFGIKQYKDSVYRGELDKRKRDGKGVIVYMTGRIYEGEW